MTGAIGAHPVFRREIGTWDTGRPGPTLLVLGGIHGNEPAGVLAAQRVLALLRERELPLVGRFVALAGNLPALERRQRYLGRDLNRGWSSGALAALERRRAAGAAADGVPEDHEQAELVRCFAAIERSASGPLVFLDLHTSSADGPPFLCLADTIDNRRLGLATGVPIILGIEETIDGASLEWFADRGIAGFAVEGGQHGSDSAVANHEAVLWVLLDHLGMLRSAIDLAPHRAQLRRAAGGAPPIVEILHRHPVSPDDGFRMEPGFVNFMRVAAGQLLATDRRGPIRAPRACHLMLPLYQTLGEDGFFLARRVRPSWLWLAKWLRAARCDALLPFLPGVRRDPDDPDTLLANPRVARWFTVEVFHLLGFRKRRERGGLLAFSRRLSRAENARL